jgi:hypothetical protein
MTGLARFVAAAADDALAGQLSSTRATALKEALVPLVPLIRAQSPAREGDQAVVDAVVEVMGRAWRPSAWWRERLLEVGRQDLAYW